MSETNVGKQQIGSDAKSVLEGVLRQAKSAGYIKNYRFNYRIGYPHYDQSQFYATFMIEFSTGERWILYSTTSLRDRLKENCWDSSNMKLIDPAIKRVYLVYPNGRPTKERKNFESKNRKIERNIIYSPLDGIISLQEFQTLLISVGTQGRNNGFSYGAEGRAFETRVANALGSKANLRVLQGTTADSIPTDIEMLRIILQTLDIDPSSIEKITATADKNAIGLLPSGGSPKTDVKSTITLKSGIHHFVTISCKKTSATSVTVGQHKADDIWLALDPTNFKLRNLLLKFQINGTLSAMSAVEIASLTAELAPYMKEFCQLILGGIGGTGEPVFQWARYVMVCHENSEDFSFYTLNDYIDLLLSKPRKHFGTPFSWTYASKSKGENIQFKAPVIS